VSAGGLAIFSVLADGIDHPECVAVSPDGVLHTGGEAGQIFAVDVVAGTAVQVASTGGFVLGISFDARGRVYACDIKHRQVLRVDLSSGEVTVYSTGTPQHPLRNPNLGCFAPDGTMYLTDSGTWHGNDGRILRVDPRGHTELWCETSTQFPNGCCLDIDDRSLLVAESTAATLARIPILADGSAGPRQVVAHLPGSVPDGVCVDSGGTAYVCCYRPDRIYAVSPDGHSRVLADDPEGTMLAAPTNAAWYGAANTHLAVANLGRWHLSGADLGVTGHSPHLAEVHS
jgi:gluconolactonase